MAGISLYTIAEALTELMSAREDLQDEIAAGPSESRREEVTAELAEVEKTLAEYVVREISKVDSIHSFLKYADANAKLARQEAAEMTERARRLEASRDRLKAICLSVMEQAGKKKLEGTAGRKLTRCGNGGLAPLNVQEDILPMEYKDVVLRMSAKAYNDIWPILPVATCLSKEVIVAQGRVREALAEGPVPGASLGERGEHLRAT